MRNFGKASRKPLEKISAAANWYLASAFCIDQILVRIVTVDGLFGPLQFGQNVPLQVHVPPGDDLDPGGPDWTDVALQIRVNVASVMDFDSHEVGVGGHQGLHDLFRSADIGRLPYITSFTLHSPLLSAPKVRWPLSVLVCRRASSAALRTMRICSAFNCPPIAAMSTTCPTRGSNRTIRSTGCTCKAFWIFSIRLACSFLSFVPSRVAMSFIEKPPRFVRCINRRLRYRLGRAAACICDLT